MTHEMTFTFPYFTGLPTDCIVNTWHFNWLEAGAPAEDDFDNLSDQLNTFYTGAFGAGAPQGMAPWVNLGAVGVKAFNLADPSPRAPLYNKTRTVSAPQSGSASLPTETALCLSFQAVQVSGQPQARRRGRIFLGGLGAVGTSAGGTDFPKPATTFMSAVASQATYMMATVQDFGWAWAIWSTVNNSSSVVNNGWVDDAFDTQRRRGQAATQRILWEL